MKVHASGLWLVRVGFFSFLICFSILPLSFSFFSPLLLAIYAASTVYFLYFLKSNWNWQANAVAGRAAIIFSVIYLIYFPYSLLRASAVPSLIVKDSVGFLFYPAYFALMAFMTRGFIEQHHWEKFLIVLGIAISIFHFVAFFAFYHWNGALTNITLYETDEFLRTQFGAASKYATGNGLLRVDSCMGILLIIPMMLVFRNILTESFSRRHHIFIAIIVSGLLLEGHRALFLAVLLSMLSYFLWMTYTTSKRTEVLARGVAAMISMVLGLLLTVTLLDSYLNMSEIFDRFAQTTEEVGIGANLGSANLGSAARIAQIRPLVDKISERPFLGSGFGAHASMIRNQARPYMYEMDYLAVIMKLGLLGGIAYFGAYLYLLYLAFKKRKYEKQAMSYFFAGAAFLLFAGTNGGMAMSVYSTLFHLYLMLGLSINYRKSGVLTN